MKFPFLSFLLFLTVALAAQKDSCDCFNLRPMPDHSSLGGRFAVHTQYESEKKFTGVCRTYFVNQADQTRDLNRTFMYGTFVQGEMTWFIQCNEEGDTTWFFKREKRDSVIAESRNYNYRTGKLETLERYYYIGREKKIKMYVYDERGILRIESNYFFPRKGDSLNYSGSFANYKRDSQLGSDGFYNIPIQEGSYLAYGGINGERVIVKGAYHHNYKSGVWTIWYDSGQRKSEGAYSQYDWMDGNWKEWYGNGQLKSDIDYCNSGFCGKNNWWYENGQLQSTATYVNFKPEGEFVTYWENGKVKNKDTYREGKVLTMEVWHDNGQQASSAHYTQTGQADGEYKQWYPDGVLSQEHTYKDGKPIGPAKWYFGSGKLSRIIECVNGERVMEKSYYENGQLWSEERYANGKKTGRWNNYTQAGIPEWHENYVDNQREGLSVYYSPTGEVKAELNFHEDKWSGVCKWYYSGGKLWREGTYAKGIRDGLFKEWSSTGVLVFEQTYEAGKPMTKKTRPAFFLRSKQDSAWMAYGSDTEILAGGLINSWHARYPDLLASPELKKRLHNDLVAIAAFSVAKFDSAHFVHFDEKESRTHVYLDYPQESMRKGDSLHNGSWPAEFDAHIARMRLVSVKGEYYGDDNGGIRHGFTSDMYFNGHTFDSILKKQNPRFGCEYFEPYNDFRNVARSGITVAMHDHYAYYAYRLFDRPRQTHQLSGEGEGAVLLIGHEDDRYMEWIFLVYIDGSVDLIRSDRGMFMYDYPY